jgi:dihydrofolate synthase/folylpolyglutamate synthase
VTYDEAIEWLLSFADFERSGRFQDRPDVAPMLALLERLGNPHLGRTTVHIAGSKGKGSVAAMVEAILRAAGHFTGLYTSPHLYSYTERIRHQGGRISEDWFVELVGKIQPAVESALPNLGGRSFVTFDLLTAMAFQAFYDCEAEAQVIEVGVGGRVDSTNVFESKEVVAITPISLEHADILGSTVDEIAREKAAIITQGCTVVMAPQPHAEAKRVIHQVAGAADARLVDVARQYRWRKLSHDVRGQTIRIEGPERTVETRFPLLGLHQVENAATAVAVFEPLRSNDDRFTDEETAAPGKGLGWVEWPCRIEVVREDPLVIVDGAHNRDSARRLRETLVEYFACDRALFVIGCGSDKDIDGLAEELAPLAARVIAARAYHPRAMAPERIAEAFGRLNVDVEIVDNVPNAVDRALAATLDGSLTLICVAGSLFVAAEARAHVLGVRT